jgi:hypothetical protein
VQKKRIVNHEAGLLPLSKGGDLTMNEPALGTI